MQDKIEKSPVVAVTFWCTRTGDKLGYNQGVLSQGNKKDIIRLKNGIQNAAINKGHTPPKVEITLFLIPDWKKGEDYNSQEYLEAKKRMLEDAKILYGDDIVIKDFLASGVSVSELNFIRNCESKGSIADIVKTRTIIDNKGRPCLQTDSNVTWANNNFNELYELTFATNQDAFNTSRCSEVYVSVHNKLLFTASDSAIPSIFNETLVDYCTKYNSDPWHKSASCNGVYDIAFCEGMSRYGLTYRVRVDDKYNPGKTFDFYPAIMDDSRYKLMPLVIACQRESWRAGMPPLDPAVEELTGGLAISPNQKKPAIEVEINGVQYGYYHFKSLVRVFTNIPSWHAEEGRYKYSHHTKDFFDRSENARNLFIAKHDTVLCMKIFAEYYNAVLKQLNEGSLLQKEHALEVLANLIPDTEAGNKLSAELFHCSVKELHKNPVRSAFMPTEPLHNHHERFLVSVNPSFAQQVAPTSYGRNPHSLFSPGNTLDKLMMKDNLKIIAKEVDKLPAKERGKAIEFFKTLPSETLETIKQESRTAQKAWDELYGIVPYSEPKI